MPRDKTNHILITRQVIFARSVSVTASCVEETGIVYLRDLDRWVHHSANQNRYLVLLVLHDKDERPVDNDVEPIVEGGGEEDDLGAGGGGALRPLLGHLDQG